MSFPQFPSISYEMVEIGEKVPGKYRNTSRVPHGNILGPLFFTFSLIICQISWNIMCSYYLQMILNYSEWWSTSEDYSRLQCAIICMSEWFRKKQEVPKY